MSIAHAIYVGKDRFENNRFKITSEHDEKSVRLINRTNRFLKKHYPKIFSPLYYNSEHDYGLITLRGKNDKLTIGDVYSFEWRPTINESWKGTKFVALHPTKFRFVKKAPMTAEIEIPEESDSEEEDTEVMLKAAIAQKE